MKRHLHVTSQCLDTFITGTSLNITDQKGQIETKGSSYKYG